MMTRVLARMRAPRWVRRLQLRDSRAPRDWRQTVAEMKDREMPWLHHSHRQAKSR